MRAKGDSLHGLGIVRSTKVDHTISRISIIVLWVHVPQSGVIER